MNTYYDKMSQYVQRAKDEPCENTSYIDGLEIAQHIIFAESTNKQELVERLTLAIEVELAKKRVDYQQVQGMITGLKEAMKLDGELDLPFYKLITPVTTLVKLENGEVVPVELATGFNYEELWTMPEILSFDGTFGEFAVKQ